MLAVLDLFFDNKTTICDGIVSPSLCMGSLCKSVVLNCSCCALIAVLAMLALLDDLLACWLVAGVFRANGLVLLTRNTLKQGV